MRIQLLLLLSSFCFADSLKILMFNPGFGHSHMRFMGGIADILIEAGHEITEIRSTLDTTARWQGISKSQEILLYPVHPEVEEMMADMHSGREGGFMSQIWTQVMSPAKMSKMAVNMTKAFAKACEHVVFETDLLQTLKGRHFDLGISESFDDCGHGIFEVLGIKTVITTSSSNLMEHQAILIGVPRVPSYVPGALADTSEKMTITQRAFNAIGSYFGAKMFLTLLDGQTEVFRKHMGPDFTDLRELISRSAVVFTNTQPYIDFPKPTIYKVIDIGGIHIKDTSNQRLDEEWNKILNKKKKTVLISFGSVAKSFAMPVSYKKSIIEVVKGMPDVQFIWKYEKDDLNTWELPENLYLSKWTPQNALLADPRLSLFVTHGGLASTMEIAYSGTPALVVPLFADQSRNAQVLMRQGVAEKILKFDLENTQKLSEVIKGMLADASYKQKAQPLSAMLKNTPFRPKDLLLKNLEFVAKFGSLPQLDPYGRQLSFIQYYLLDVFAAFVLAAISVLVIAFFVLRFLFRLCFQKSKPKRD
ncbi:unnamed protein product, partial [Mesorhabditis spiculigera]